MNESCGYPPKAEHLAHGQTCPLHFLLLILSCTKNLWLAKHQIQSKAQNDKQNTYFALSAQALPITRRRVIAVRRGANDTFYYIYSPNAGVGIADYAD